MARTLFDDQEPRASATRRRRPRRRRPARRADAPAHPRRGRGPARRWWGRAASCAGPSPPTACRRSSSGGRRARARRRSPASSPTETSSHFVPFSAVTSGIKEVKEVMAEAVRLRKAQGRRTLLFVDEIHRFNRAQQDAFLPYVESGDVVLVGATTENPSFELNAALLSRCRVVVLEPLHPEDLAGADAPRARRSRARAWGVRRRGGRRGPGGAGASSPRGMPGRRSTSWSWRWPTPRAGGSTPRRCAGWPSARCCSTTSRGRSTST